jgi:hypothetical protein
MLCWCGHHWSNYHTRSTYYFWSVSIHIMQGLGLSKQRHVAASTNYSGNSRATWTWSIASASVNVHAYPIVMCGLYTVHTQPLSMKIIMPTFASCIYRNGQIRNAPMLSWTKARPPPLNFLESQQLFSCSFKDDTECLNI